MVAVNDKVMSEETARALFELGGAVIEARAASQGLVDVLRENKTDGCYSIMMPARIA